MNITKLRGSRVLLDQPEYREFALELSEEVKRQILEEETKRHSHLTVCAVGDEVTDVKVGDVVYVSPSTLAMAEVVEIDEEVKIMVRAMDIAIIW
jgi:hypothetical protein